MEMEERKIVRETGGDGDVRNVSESRSKGLPINQRRTCKRRKISQMSEDEKQEFREKIKFYRLEKKIREELLSEGEREQLKNERYMKRMAYFASIPKEEMAERKRRAKEYNRIWWASMPEERKKRVGQRNIQRLKNLEGEALQKHIESRRRGVKKYHRRLKEKDRTSYLTMMQRNIRKRWDKFCEYQREKVKNETREQRENRLLRYRVYLAKRKARREMEEDGILSREEIDKRLEQVEEEVRMKPTSEKKSEYKPRTAARKPRIKMKECEDGGGSQVQQEIDSNLVIEEEISDQPTTIVFHPGAELCLSGAPSQTTAELVLGPPQSKIQLPVSLSPFLEIVVVNADTWTTHEGHVTSQDFLLPAHQGAFTTHSSEFCHEDCGSGDDDHIGGELIEIQSTFTTEDQLVVVEQQDPSSLSISEKTYIVMEETQNHPTPSSLILLPPPPPTTSPRPPVTPPPTPPTELQQPIIHIPPKKYICDECGHLFSTPRGVRDHKHKKHNPVGSNLTCPECQVVCPSPASLWTHFSLHHATTQEISSPHSKIAPVPKSTPVSIRRQRSEPGTIKNGRYYRGTEEPNGNECPECRKKFHQKSTLDDHIRRVHQGKGQYPCPICSYDMQSPAKLWRHQVERHDMRDLPPPKGIPVIFCEYCSDVVLRGYPQHIQKKHPEHFKEENQVVVVTGTQREEVDFRVKCPHCPSLLRCKAVLAKHLKYKHSDHQQQHKCSECGKLFKSKSLMTKHLSQTHLFSDLERKLEAKKLIRFISSKKKSGAAVCLICDAHLPVRISIKAHFVSDHHDVLKGSESDGGVAHMQIHHCKFCPQNFSTGAQLDSHLKGSHPNQIFKCGGGNGGTGCDVVKMTRKELKNHQKTHTRSRGNPEETTMEKKGESTNNYWRGGPEVKQFIKNKLRSLKVHCPECEQVLELQSVPSHLKRFHQKSQQANDDEEVREMLECPACEKHFPNQMYQLAHSHLIHSVPLGQLVKLADGEVHKSNNQGKESHVTRKKGSHSTATTVAAIGNTGKSSENLTTKELGVRKERISDLEEKKKLVIRVVRLSQKQVGQLPSS